MGGDELALVQEAFATNWIAPLGPHVDAFESEFAERAGVAHAAALSSGTAALHLALRWLDLQPGDEVICSTLTFSASVNPVLYERATPVFVDCDRSSWNMDPALLIEAVEDRIRRGRKPKAVVLVHLYGQSADIDLVAATCAKHGIPLIEDAAEALGAIYFGHEKAQKDEFGSVSQPSTLNTQLLTMRRHVVPGSVGLCGIHSFNGNKIITTSGGGMLVSNDKALIDKARYWATQARDPAPHYQHSEIGFNYRMSNVLAAIGRGQLRVLEQRVAARRQNFARYESELSGLPGIGFMPEANYGRSTRWLSCIMIDPQVAGLDREKVRLALAEENIEARPVWKPMHLQPIFKDCACYGGTVAEEFFNRGLCLPSGSNLSAADLDRVVDAVQRAFARR